MVLMVLMVGIWIAEGLVIALTPVTKSASSIEKAGVRAILTAEEDDPRLTFLTRKAVKKSPSGSKTRPPICNFVAPASTKGVLCDPERTGAWPLYDKEGCVWNRLKAERLGNVR